MQEDLVAFDFACDEAQAADVVAVEPGAVGQGGRVAADDDRAQRHVDLVDGIGGEELEQQVAPRFDEEMANPARGEAFEDPVDRDVAVAVCDEVQQMLGDVGIPDRLGKIGVDPARVPDLVEVAIKNVGPNPRRTGIDDMRQLIESAL